VPSIQATAGRKVVAQMVTVGQFDQGFNGAQRFYRIQLFDGKNSPDWKFRMTVYLDELDLVRYIETRIYKLNLGCLHPVACVRSGDGVFYIHLRNVTVVG
jgi:hypothetical protein